MVLRRVRPIVVLLAVAVTATGCGGAVAGTPDVRGDGGAGGEGGGGSGGCPPLETRTLTPLCRADGWCWIDPYPQGHALPLAEGSGPDDVWFAGPYGTVLRHGPAGFSLDPFPIGDTIYGLGVAGPDDVWAATGGASLYHRDANGWQAVTPRDGTTFGLLFASPAAGVWVRGNDAGGSVILRRTTGGWEEVVRGLSYPNAIWASGPDDAWFGETYGVAHWDGERLTRPSGLGAVRSISGSAADDVWLVGRFGEVWRWNGAEAVQVQAPRATRVRVAARGDVWLWGDGAIAHGDGGAWQELIPPFTPVSLWPEGGETVWIAGARGEVARWDGSAWLRLDRRLPPLNALDVDPDGRIRAVGPGGVVGIDPETLTAAVEASALGSARTIGAWARESDDLFVLGDPPDLRRWDGCAWSAVEPLHWSGGISTADGVLFGGGADDAGAWTLRRFDGAEWSFAPLPGRPTAVRATGADEALVAVETDTGAAVLRWDHGALASVASGPMRVEDLLDDGDRVRAVGYVPGSDWGLDSWYLLEGRGWLEYTVGGPGAWLDVWASGPTDVWFLGTDSDGEPPVATSGVVHWNGSAFAGRQAWNPYEMGFSDLAGTGPDDVWISGAGMARWQGEGFGRLPAPDAEGRWVIQPFPGGEAWAAGPGLVHFDGTSWGEVLRPELALEAFWAAGPSDVWAAGAGGALLHFDGTSWEPRASGLTETLAALTGTGPSDVWAAGSAGTVLHFDGAAWSTVLDLARPVITAQAIGEGLWLGTADGTLLRIEAGTVVHEEQTGLGIAGLAAFGADDLWIAGRSSDGLGAIRHWDGDAWSRHDVGLVEAGAHSRFVRRGDRTWIRSERLLREEGPGGRATAAPVDELGPLKVDRLGDFWGIAGGGGDGGAMLRYRPPAR